jgi:uncharacterized membrane-anchored protein YitT (DUF2179 family)
MPRWLSRETLWRLLVVVCGSILASVGVNLFLVPSNLLTAGVAGVALLISYVSPIPAGVALFALNIPIFAAGWRVIDRDFVLWSLVGMVGLSAGLAATSSLALLAPVKDFYLNVLAGGTLAGIGCGMVFRVRASQGGTDVIAAMVRRYWSVSIGGALFVLNASVVVFMAFGYGLEKALATIVVILVESVVIERTIIGIDANKAMIIITRKPAEVAAALMDKLGRGVTFLHGEGAYTGEAKEVVYCIITTRQLAHARKVVSAIDPACFTTVHDVTEVIGKGFKQLPI